MANPQTWTDPNTGDVYELIPDTAPAPAAAPKTWTDPTSGDTYELIPDKTPPAPSTPRSVPMVGNSEQTVASLAFKNNPEAAAAAQSLWDAGVRDPAAYNAALGSKFPQFKNKIMTAADIAAARQRDAWFKARGKKNPGNFVFTEPTGITDPAAPTSMLGAFGEGAAKGLETMANSATGLAALGADLVGADQTGDYLLNKYIENQKKIQFNHPSAVNSVQDINSLGDAGMYVADTLGNLVPQITSSMGIGGASSLLGKVAAEKMAADAVKGELMGTALGTFANTAAQETGSIYGDTYQSTGVKAPVSSLVAGLAAGGLDAITPFRALRRLGVPAEAITDKLATRLLKSGAKDAFIEGGTEAAQTFIEGLPEAVVTGKSPFTEKMLDQMVDTFVRGAIGGGVVGTATEALAPEGATNAPAPAQETPPVETPPTEAPVQSEPDTPLPFEAPDFLNTPAKSPFKKTPDFLNQSAKPKKGRAAPVETATPVEPTPEPLAVNKEQAADHINNVIASDWKNAPPITTVDSLDQLPADVRQNIIDDGAQDAKGVTVNGQVYILAQNLKSLDDLAGVAYHEALGHAGLGMQFGKRLNTVLEQMYNTNQMVREAADAWLASNSTQAENAKAHAVEEVLAETSEGGKVDSKVMDKIKAFVKQYARRVPGLKNLKYTDKEVIAILSMANNKVINGKGKDTSGNGARYIRTYHGTPHDFDQFDHSKMGSGEGAQAYGWGTYVAENKGVAVSYKDKLAGTRVQVKGKDGNIHSEKPYNAMALSRHMDLPKVEGYQSSYPAQWVLNRLSEGASLNEAIKEMKTEAYPHFPKATLQAAEKALKAHEPSLNTFGGKLMEVDLPDNATWLNLDTSIEDQPEILKKLRDDGEIPVFTQDEWQTRIDYYNDLLWSDNQKDIALAERMISHLKDEVIHPSMDGMEVYRAITANFEYNAKKASEYLKSIGIDGNKYFDGMSRNRAEGTSNYVVFDDKTPKIVNKYSKPDNSERPRGLRTDKIIGKKRSFYEPFLAQLEEDGQPRTVQTWKETEELAQGIGMNVDKVMKLDRGPKAEEYTAGVNFMMGRLNLIGDLSEKIQNGEASDRDKDKFNIYIRQFADMYDVLSETKTNIARTLNIMNRIVENQKAASNNLRYMLSQESEQLLTDPSKVKLLAEKINQLKGNPIAQAKAVKLMTDPRFEDYIQDIWFNSVLSNPVTHKINVLGSVGNFLTDLAEHSFAAAIGQFKRGNPNSERVLAREVLWRFYGAAMGMKGAFSKSAQAFKAGEPVTKVGALERSHNLVKGRFGSLLEGPSKALAAEDEFMRNIIQTSSYYGMAIRKAAAEGLKGQDLFTRANELVVNPTDEMILTAADYTRALQFVDKPSKPARTYLTLMSRKEDDGAVTRSVKFLGSLFTPFIPTADSIFRSAIRRSPLGAMDRYNQTDWKAGGARKDVAKARVIMGSMLALWVANEVLKGNISGNGPDDYRRRAELEAGGWRPNAIKMGDKWVPFDGLDPLALNLSIVANAVEDYKERKVDDKGYADQAAAALGGTVRALGNSSWLKSLAFITEGINDARTGQQAIENLALNTSTGLVPYSGMGRFMGNMRDPVERDVSSDGTMAGRFEDRVKSITPFLKSTLPARHDVYGREKDIENRKGLGWLGRQPQSTIDTNPTVVELQRLAEGSNKTLIPPVGKDDAKKYGIERLNSRDYQQYQEHAGNLILAAVKEAMDSPDWENLTDEDRFKEVKNIAKDMRAMALEDLFGPLEETNEDGRPEDEPND